MPPSSGRPRRGPVGRRRRWKPNNPAARLVRRRASRPREPRSNGRNFGRSSMHCWRRCNIVGEFLRNSHQPGSQTPATVSGEGRDRDARGAAARLGRRLRRRPDDPGGCDVIELREASLEIGIPLGRNARLVGCLPITSVDRIDDAHPFHHAPEWRESHPVEPHVGGVVNEELIASRVGTAGGEDDRPSLVALDYRVIEDGTAFPAPIHGRIAVHPELRHESRHGVARRHPDVVGQRLHRLRREVMCRLFAPATCCIVRGQSAPLAARTT